MLPSLTRIPLFISLFQHLHTLDLLILSSSASADWDILAMRFPCCMSLHKRIIIVYSAPDIFFRVFPDYQEKHEHRIFPVEYQNFSLFYIYGYFIFSVSVIKTVNFQFLFVSKMISVDIFFDFFTAGGHYCIVINAHWLSFYCYYVYSI